MCGFFMIMYLYGAVLFDKILISSLKIQKGIERELG